MLREHLRITKTIFTCVWQIWGLILCQKEECRSHTHKRYIYYFFFPVSQETFNLQILLFQVTNLNTFPKDPMNEEPWIQVTFEMQF